MGKKVIASKKPQQNERPSKFSKNDAKANTKLDKAAARADQNVEIKNNVDILQLIKPDIQFLIARRNEDSKEKTDKAQKVYSQIEGLLFQITQTKIGGRALQLVIKCASPELRAEVFQKLISNRHFSELLQTKYGHYIGITMIRNMVPSQKQPFFDVLLKHIYHYAGHADASVVVDRFLLKVASPSQINQMKKVFSQHSEKIDNLAMKIIEKGLQNNLLSLQILKVALPNLIPAERDKVVEFFQQLPTFEYLRHKDGLTLFCAILNLSDKKQRKTVLKNFAQHMAQTQEHLKPNSYFFLAVIKFLYVLDDTKVSSKSLLLPLMPSWMDHAHTYKIVASVFNSKLIDFTLYETPQVANKFSLKEESARLGELQESIIHHVLEGLGKQEDLVFNPNLSRFAASVFRFLVQQSSNVGFEWFQSILERLLVVSEATKYTSSEQADYWILTHPDAQRLAKAVILLEPVAEKQELWRELVFDFSKRIQQILFRHLNLTLESKAIYLLIALLEHSSRKEAVRAELQKQKKQLNQYKSNQGMDILMKQLQ